MGTWVVPHTSVHGRGKQQGFLHVPSSNYTSLKITRRFLGHEGKPEDEIMSNTYCEKVKKLISFWNEKGIAFFRVFWANEKHEVTYYRPIYLSRLVYFWNLGSVRGWICFFLKSYVGWIVNNHLNKPQTIFIFQWDSSSDAWTVIKEMYITYHEIVTDAMREFGHCVCVQWS